MKFNITIKFWLLIAAIASILVVGAYGYNFYGQPLSSLTSDWANFGSYIGGTLGSLFAFFAFLAAIETYQDGKKQKSLEATLASIEKYESRFKRACELSVSCDEPWIWGQKIEASESIKALSLRTLLHSDSIDWEYHLIILRDSLAFHNQPNGELYQDRDVWLEAKNSIEGLFGYLNLYDKNGGDTAILEFYKSTYEIPFNRLQDSDYETAA